MSRTARDSYTCINIISMSVWRRTDLIYCTRKFRNTFCWESQKLPHLVLQYRLANAYVNFILPNYRATTKIVFLLTWCYYYYYYYYYYVTLHKAFNCAQVQQQSGLCHAVYLYQRMPEVWRYRVYISSNSHY